MQRPIYIFHLFDEEMYPLYVDANGNVQRGNKDTLLQQDGITPARLVHAPQDWENTQIKYRRNIKYWGLFREAVFAMKFVGDGAQILRHFKWTYGSEAVLHLSISKLNLTQHPDKYETMMVTEINLAKYKQQRGIVTVDVLEGGLSKYFKAYENTVYEIPIDDSATFMVRMDGMEFDFSRQFAVMANQECYGTANFFMGLTETAREGNAPDQQFQSIFFTPSSPYPNDNWVHWFDGAVTMADMDMVIAATVKVYYNKSVTPIIRAEVINAAGSIVSQTVLWSIAGAAGTTTDAAINSTITVPAGCRLHIKQFGGNPTDSDTQFTIVEGLLSFNYVYRYAETLVKCISLYRLLQLLVSKITDGKYTCSSDWLSNFKEIAVTCGDALRGIADSSIKTSFNQFFKSIITKDFNKNGAGMAINNNILQIERLKDYFKSDIGIVLEEVSEFEITNAEDLMFNTIKTGYPKTDYTDTNGKYETNQGQQWTTSKKKDVRELDLVSDYRADALGIELTRINFEGKKTTDSSSDNDTFLLHIETDVDDTITIDSVTYNIYNLYRPSYSAFTGLPHWQSSFNTELTPKHSLLYSGGYLHAILDYMETEQIKFQSSDKNKEQSSTLNGVTVTQNESITIDSLAPKLFRPYYFTFKTRVPITLMDILSISPYSKVRFKYNDIVYYGYLLDGGIQPADNDSQTWKLLCSADTDVSKFIKNFN